MIVDVEKWYYEITDTITGEALLVKASLPIKQEKLCDFLGLDGCTAVSVTKEYYEENVDDD